MTAAPPASPTLNLAARVAGTEAEGPGLRFALWVQGCPFRCDGCCNPEMLPFRPATAVPVEALLAEIAATPGLEGVTFLGGEPFAQAGALAALAEGVRERGLSVLVFTGYAREALAAARRADWDALLGATDLLVDGPYLPGVPSPHRFVGSGNQRLHPLTARGSALAAGFDGGPEVVETRLDAAGRVFVNGWPDAELVQTLSQRR